MAKTKVVHLLMDGKNYYFGSVKAMFNDMGESRMGMSYRSFHSNVRLEEDVTYHNRRRGYEVTMSYLRQARSNRGLQGSARAAHILRMQKDAGVMPTLDSFMTQKDIQDMSRRLQPKPGETAQADDAGQADGPVRLDLFS